MRNETKLVFEGVDCDFSDHKSGTIVSGLFHNEKNRVTIIKQGSMAITLER